MTIAKEFFENLKIIGEKEPLIAVFLKNNLHSSDGLTFETILKEYANYFGELSNSDKKKLSIIFWEQIKLFGTPIIEDDLQDHSKCNVYFLFPKNKLENTTDLYLQGAFHGFYGVKERNKLDELSNTGIMYRINSIHKNAILNYQYQQQGTPNLDDDYSFHRNMYHHRYSGGIILRVNPDRKQSHLGNQLGKNEEENYWDRILSSENTNSSRNFKYQTTLYSDSNNKLQTYDIPLPQNIDIYNPSPSGYDLLLMSEKDFNENAKNLGKPIFVKMNNGDFKLWGNKSGQGDWQETVIKYFDFPKKWESKEKVFVASIIDNDIFNTLKKGHTYPSNHNEIPLDSPYANFIRAVHIFKPSSDEIKINNIIVFNDGRPYILAGMMDQAEKMVNSGKLPADTALVFIDVLQGLAKTMPGIENDERFNMGGMGVRLIDFDKGIDAYITFLKELFPQLEKNLKIPNVSGSRIMIGASLSGTASICIALKEPELFNYFIAQSPSPSNDEILKGLKANQEASIQLSYGFFEQPRYTDAETDFYKYAKNLGKRLSLQPKERLHGHNSAAWVDDLEQSLPAALKSNQLDTQELKKSTKSPSINSQSIFSHPPKESPIKTDKKDETIQVLRKRGG